MIKSAKILLGALFSVLMLLAGEVEACTCRMEPNPPCRAVNEADAVFEAHVLRVEKIEPDGPSYLRRRFTMKVRKAYKGTVREAVFVDTGVGDSDCGYRFKIGGHYMVYAYEHEGRLTASTCTRTREVQNAKLDRAYFESLPTLPRGATIFGKVVQSVKKANEWLQEAMGEIKIEIDGPEKRTVSTDAAGLFSIGGLTPGRYQVKALMPEGFRLSIASALDLYPYPIYHDTIADKGCLEAFFVLERNP